MYLIVALVAHARQLNWRFWRLESRDGDVPRRVKEGKLRGVKEQRGTSGAGSTEDPATLAAMLFGRRLARSARQ